MPIQVTEILGVRRLMGISKEIEDIRSLPTYLLGLQRTAVKDAQDGDVMMRVSGRTIAADIVADDARAVLKSRPPVRLTTTHIPNIKGGRAFSQEEINLLDRVFDSRTTPAEIGSAQGYVTDAVDDALEGVKVRVNALIVGMWCDQYTYDANGIVFTNLSWGTPSDLKVTPATLWNQTTATPVTDVNAVVENARVKYGRRYNRMTLSTTALRNASLTTQFQALAQLRLPSNLASTQTAAYLAASDINSIAGMAANVWGLDVVEVYDDTFDAEANDGTIVTARYLPANKVVLSNTADDNNPRVMDFANAVVTESKVARWAGQTAGLVGAIPPDARGPLPYAMATFNPPRMELWAVQRGFPRKHVETATACLTVA